VITAMRGRIFISKGMKNRTVLHGNISIPASDENIIGDIPDRG
jgi:hypothetical protein